MKAEDRICDAMVFDTIYTVKDLALTVGYTTQKTALILHKLCEKGYVKSINFSQIIRQKIGYEKGYMLKG